MGVRWPDVPLSALSTLEHLCKDPRNTVFIVSGCNCDLLTQKFGGVPGLGLVAEHGYFIQRALLGNDARIGRYRLRAVYSALRILSSSDVLFAVCLLKCEGAGSVMETFLTQKRVPEIGEKKRKRSLRCMWTEPMDRRWSCGKAQCSSDMGSPISSLAHCKPPSSRSTWRAFSRYDH